MIAFNKKYFTLFTGFLLSEIMIAKFATGFIRFTLGDYLVVMLLYCFIKSFFNISMEKTALLVLGIAFAIEFLQLTNLQNQYPEKYEKFLRIILGTSFSIEDLIAYLLGIVTVVFIEKKLFIKNFIGR